MQKRKSTGSIFISNLDPNIKERILNLDVEKDKLRNFEEIEKMEKVSSLNDLKDLLNHTETEILSTLNSLYCNSQFFIYCGPLLVNINPGPGRTYDYLNLQKWTKDTNKTDDSLWKPHLYAYVNYVYQILCSENKDQVINMLGQIGSGKTFNLVHMIEYLTVLAGPENMQLEVFDLIHKSIQLIHIMGSIYRQNNVESTCCGLLLNLSFDDNNKICNFDIESKIVDFTLPFSENGRSFTILHALMCANSELKKTLELPESENLNFFKKFHKNFDAKTKEKFKLNDMEIWTRFHSLLNFFGFHKGEVLEILELLSFILLLNECAIGKKKFEDHYEYFLNKSASTKKIAKNLNVSEDDFLIKIGVYKSMNDIKSALIKLMKYTYFLVFEYIKTKVKRYSNKYFEILKQENTAQNEENNKTTKSLYFIDIPSEIDDQTLGGLSTNLANECLNLFASHQYLSLVEKLEKEKIKIKFISPLHCVDVVNALIGENGLTHLLSEKFSDKIFYKFKAKCNSIPHLRNTIEFSEPENIAKATKLDQYVFRFKYSHKSVVYNLESLSLEAKSLSFSKRLLNILDMSSNKVIKIILKTKVRSTLLETKSFFNFVHSNILDIFAPLQGLSPFIVYCFHSNNSLKIFFGDKSLENNMPNWRIPEKLTTELCKHSLLLPVLYWEWFGYHEWISIDKFIFDFANDFEILKDKIIRSKSGKTKDVNFKDLKKNEICTFILTIIIGETQYIIGQNYIIFKRGVLKDIRKILDNLTEIHRLNRKTASVDKKENQKRNSLDKNKVQKSASLKSDNKEQESKKKDGKNGINSQFSLIKSKKSAPNLNIRPSRKHTLKILCEYNILEDKGKNEKIDHFSQPLNYNLFKYLNNPSPCLNFNNSIDEKINVFNYHANEEVKIVEDYVKKNNVIVVNNMNTFNVFKNVLVVKNTNYELFDYSDYSEQISKIESCFRAFKARRKYRIYRYVIRKIISMQKFIRAWVIRKKFERYVQITRKVMKIQKCFKKLIGKKINAVMLVQQYYRKYVLRKKEKGEFHIETEKKENSKLADELFEVGNEGREKRKNLRLISQSKLDIETTEAKLRKEPELNNEQVLEQLMDMDNKNFMDESMLGSMGNEKIIKKQKKRVKGEKGGKRIEDKLMEHGENLKKKKVELKLQKIKEEETELLFKPKTNFSSSKNGLKFNETDFMNRMYYFKNKQEIKLDEMRSKKVENHSNEFTFKPKLSQKAMNFGKRTVDDLYNWQFRRDENLNKKIKEKQSEEERKMEEECSKKHKINLSSEIILQQKFERMSKNENNEGDFDLWPVQLQKVYFEKK